MIRMLGKALSSIMASSPSTDPPSDDDPKPLDSPHDTPFFQEQQPLTPPMTSSPEPFTEEQLEFNRLSDDKREARLRTLIERSSIYASIIADNFARQQAEKEQARKKAAAKSLSTTTTTPATTPATSSVSTRTSSTRSRAPAKKSTTSTSRKTRKAQYSITNFIKTDDDNADLTTPVAPPSSSSSRQPALVTGGVLKDYQIAGVEWLITLYENGLNGILADEMGLGKTLQTISFLAHLREKGSNGPFLIVAPLSTLDNWVNEFKRFAPSIPVLLYHGSPEDRAAMRAEHLLKRPDKSYPVVVTSYNLILNDGRFLRNIPWKFVIIDEGHRIKNMNCKLILELKSYNSANRLLLTGTPLQNNLSELWSLLNFLLPDIFHDVVLFQSWFDFSALQRENGTHEILANERKSQIVSSLHAILKPFLLRRLKTDVELQLPPKREYVLYAPLTPSQQELYKHLLDRDVKQYLTEKIMQARGIRPLEEVQRRASPRKRKASIEQQDDRRRSKRRAAELASKAGTYTELSDSKFFRALEAPDELLAAANEEDEEMKAIEQIANANRAMNNKKLQNVIMQLRLACDSPLLFYAPWEDEHSLITSPDERIVNDSGKMLLLDRMLPELFARGHKVLIFSQFTKMLDIIEDYARLLRGWEVSRLDGGVKQEDRKIEMEKFTAPTNECNLFLLSTRAGGLGINLTAADTVVLFDSDWNPQQDLQAMDRAHRIGQTRPVIVYRFATANTVEQTMLSKAESKRQLEKLVIQKGKFRSVAGGDRSSSSSSSSSSRLSAEDELRNLLLGDDGLEKVVVKERGDVILTDAELDELLDRSPEAYRTAAAVSSSSAGEMGEDRSGSSVFKVVDTAASAKSELL
ncbi:SWI/SNF chromatin remodeling complex component [Myxozyma melibiosi]|uniref:SWI/SNF chromatin remodeling complex component n=1 Tax=Myxozyma melibiosi TaxID=54550 RepID=A0ABR1F2X6_9ASCO